MVARMLFAGDEASSTEVAFDRVKENFKVKNAAVVAASAETVPVARSSAISSGGEEG